jgi:hypothetical protein
MYTWQNIFPRHDIVYAMCQGIFFQYSFDVSKIFKKRFVHAHVLMLNLPRSPFSIPLWFTILVAISMQV